MQQPLSHSATFSFLRAGGWDDNEPSSCLHGRCCATCWVGAGLGWDDNDPSSCLHGRCYATRWVGAGVGDRMLAFLEVAYAVDATPLRNMLGRGGVWG